MDNKLQELTDKIYEEGITKGREKAEAIISEARNEAEKIRKSSEKEAEEIIAKAERDAEELKKITLSELRISFRNSMNSLKQEVENLITGKIIDEPVSKVLSDTSFVAKLIEITAEKIFSVKDGAGADINVPEEMIGDLKQYLSKQTAKAVSSGIVLHPVKSMGKGFEIVPHGKEYKIRVTEADFTSYLKAFLRPGLIDLLFEQEK
ncbi:MAG: hypothetical protein JXN62_06765 [Bacteroidales bacterium]|nr:hypothetical protein [Bacteroidales bacterium]